MRCVFAKLTTHVFHFPAYTIYRRHIARREIFQPAANNRTSVKEHVTLPCTIVRTFGREYWFQNASVASTFGKSGNMGVLIISWLVKHPRTRFPSQLHVCKRAFRIIHVSKIFPGYDNVLTQIVKAWFIKHTLILTLPVFTQYATCPVAAVCHPSHNSGFSETTEQIQAKF